MKNPVAKYAPEFNKARVFRDRKTHAKETGDYKEHHRLAPYERRPLHNLLLEWETDEQYEAEPVLGDDDFDLQDEEVEEEYYRSGYCEQCNDYHVYGDDDDE